LTIDRPARRVAAMEVARVEMVRTEMSKGGRCCWLKRNRKTMM